MPKTIRQLKAESFSLSNVTTTYEGNAMRCNAKLIAINLTSRWFSHRKSLIFGLWKK